MYIFIYIYVQTISPTLPIPFTSPNFSQPSSFSAPAQPTSDKWGSSSTLTTCKRFRPSEPWKMASWGILTILELLHKWVNCGAKIGNNQNKKIKIDQNRMVYVDIYIYNQWVYSKRIWSTGLVQQIFRFGSTSDQRDISEPKSANHREKNTWRYWDTWCRWDIHQQ